MWLDIDQAVLRTVLETNARDFPDRPVVTFESGECWTSSLSLDAAYRAANVLAARGVHQRGRVAIILPNGPEFARAWWGTRCLGASIHPISPALKGHFLRRPLEISEPDVVVISRALASELADELSGFQIVDPAELESGAATPSALERPIQLDDPEIILMTSGTTGPSKLWSATVAQASTTGTYVRDAGLDSDSRFLVDLPLFHTAGLGVTTACMRAGAQVFLRARPSLVRFLDIAIEHRITASFMVGSMSAKLMEQPESPLDRAHQIDVLVASPLPVNMERFVERFGIRRLLTSYGSTETGGPIGTGGGPTLPVPGTCGRERPGWGEYKLVDAQGQEVAAGEPGELLLRPGLEAARKGYYLKDPDATAEAWAGGWFHTGDLFRKSPAGDYFFLERNRDSLRRRGENVSSFEVEREVLLEEGVLSVACVGVEATDDVGMEIKVWIVPIPGVEQLDFAAISTNLSRRMPAYMVPRFYEIADELPMTATNRVQKAELRSRGNGPMTWDRLNGGSRP